MQLFLALQEKLEQKQAELSSAQQFQEKQVQQLKDKLLVQDKLISNYEYVQRHLQNEVAILKQQIQEYVPAQYQDVVARERARLLAQMEIELSRNSQ